MWWTLSHYLWKELKQESMLVTKQMSLCALTLINVKKYTDPRVFVDGIILTQAMVAGCQVLMLVHKPYIRNIKSLLLPLLLIPRGPCLREKLKLDVSVYSLKVTSNRWKSKVKETHPARVWYPRRRCKTSVYMPISTISWSTLFSSHASTHRFLSPSGTSIGSKLFPPAPYWITRNT